MKKYILVAFIMLTQFCYSQQTGVNNYWNFGGVLSYKGNTIIDGSNSSTECKTAGDDYIISSNFICSVNNGDKIKIMVTSDKNTSSVTAVSGSISAFQIP